MTSKNWNSYPLHEQEALATVNVNLGLGDSNPVLKIYQNTDIQKLVKQLIEHYNLPQKLFAVIMAKVQQRLQEEQYFSPEKIPVRQNRSSLLKKQNLEKSRQKKQQQEKIMNPLGTKNNKTQIVLKKKQKKDVILQRKSIQSAYSSNNSFIKREASQKNLSKTHHNKSKSSVSNRQSQSPLNKNSLSKGKYQTKYKPLGSISPKPNTNKQNMNSQNRTPSFQNHKGKINQITPKKITKVVQNVKLSTSCSSQQKVKQLFLFMTKKNPPHIKILTPQHINLKGIQKQYLQNLQQFFQKLQEDQFDKMTLDYFIKKVKLLKFQKILSQIRIN